MFNRYLNSVLPSEYGVQKPWYFIFTEPVKFFRSKTKKSKSLPTNQVHQFGFCLFFFLLNFFFFQKRRRLKLSWKKTEMMMIHLEKMKML